MLVLRRIRNPVLLEWVVFLFQSLLFLLKMSFSQPKRQRTSKDGADSDGDAIAAFLEASASQGCEECGSPNHQFVDCSNSKKEASRLPKWYSFISPCLNFFLILTSADEYRSRLYCCCPYGGRSGCVICPMFDLSSNSTILCSDPLVLERPRSVRVLS